MGNKKINMPQSTAGITRYFDEYQSKIHFKPGHVIVLTIIVFVVTILLHMYGKKLLGM
jgi:preprotein translocase subunit Sec61beta